MTNYNPTPAYSAAPVEQKYNVLAIVAFVISLLSFNVIAIVLGAIALNQIKKTGEKGRGLALAGVIIGAVSIVLYIVLFIVIFAVAAGQGTVTTY
ncbi:DUF4190 domain-containing protein [Herbiconiux liangxiaofengii]|uniref:DUF4190 domain-containing protein n=1 Tax=Herbiconiux liangxiaofengii TaxID=3342795 RepID=UPI0035B9B27F